MYSMMDGTYSEAHEYEKIKVPALAFFAIGYQKDVDRAETLPGPERQEVLEFLKTQRKYHDQEVEHFRREIPNGRVIVFTNAVHTFAFDRDDEVLRETREFLAARDSVAAEEPEPVLTDAALRQILEERIKARKAVGIVVGRLQGTNRSVVAAGTMALNSSRPVDGNTVFEIGSVTKVFTGTLLADMANHGEVQPDDPVSKYLPPALRMPSRNGKVITLAHLASHHSGLPREIGNRPPGESKPSPAYSPELVFEFLSGYELPRDPGSAYEYSNLGMGLLGDSISRRAGATYEQLVLDRICKPLGLNDTRIKFSEDMQSRFPIGYDHDLKPAKGFERLSLAGVGGLRSTANDFLKFLAAVLNPADDRLSKAIRASQVVRTTLGAGREVAWGWHFNTVSDEIITHSGLTSGFHTFMGVNRKRNRAVVIFSNSSHYTYNIGMRLLDPLGQPDESTLERYVGTYEVTPIFAVTVSREKYDMYARTTGDSGASELYSSGRDQFYGAGFSLSFKTNTSGAASELILRIQDKEHRAIRK
ncbi:MAG: serine hydrolase [Verrucomicrobiales bacterium]|nr:serine hydrolase [Verrucomicrobiales bacterium]